MKKLLVLSVIILLASCDSNRTLTQSLTTGKFITVRKPPMEIYKVGDTIVIESRESSSSTIYSVYGKYIGTLPKNYVHKYKDSTEVIYLHQPAIVLK